MKLLERIYGKFFDKAYSSQKISYSQCGEDIIVDFVLTWVLGIKEPSYMDIGAHHPYWINNTYLFYKRGLTGINIEPDPVLFDTLIKKRPNDVNINKGIGFNKEKEIADFYIMSSRTLNTFSKEEAERVNKIGDIKIEEIKQIELININTILSEYFSGKPLDFLSIDVEGLDLDILKSIDFKQNKPNVICVETIVFTEGRTIKKLQPTIDFLLANGYFSYADTSINTIFVRADIL
ncbi:MAG: FkbM family methyltransferase [Ferruginibacter sp.]